MWVSLSFPLSGGSFTVVVSKQKRRMMLNGLKDV